VRTDIRILGRGNIGLAEFEARLSAYLNAGAPEPVLEGTPERRRAIWQLVASRGDRQMKALAAQYLAQIADS
jgi:hypothetical protein